VRTVAILPIKSFTEAKQRLSNGLTASWRRALAEAMFSDVLVALKRTHSLTEIIVVTADHGARQIAGGYGATVIDDKDQGHNVAAGNGVNQALKSGAERALMIPGDCPLLDPEQLGELIERPASERSVLVVPDRHGTGTNALLLTPPDVFIPAFGPGSRRRHVDNARAADAVAEVVEIPSLALDVDTPEDLTAVQSALASTHGGAARTRGMLNQMSRSLA
jgi:2-phospho-L-lactate/phosphoenolpyruvate guanylyltransferase